MFVKVNWIDVLNPRGHQVFINRSKAKRKNTDECD